MKKYSKSIIILAFASLVFASSTGGYIGQRQGYVAGHNTGYDTGYKSGYHDAYELGYYDGYNLGYASHIEYRDVIHYVDREVIKEVIKPKKFREFDSLAELKDWLAKDITSTILFADETGKIDLLNPKLHPRGDCDDYAYYLQRQALADGYLMSTELIRGNTHMGNSTCIGNFVYIIEPQTDEILDKIRKD